MMRSFLTRLSSSVAQGSLLTPCLLICLACATPFPFENLQEGMTTEAVLEKFGEPKATEARGAQSCWTYWNEEQDWFGTFFPISPLGTLLSAPFYPTTWDGWYIIRNSVFLHFYEEKLVNWVAIEPNATTLSPSPGIAWGMKPDGSPGGLGAALKSRLSSRVPQENVR